MIDINYLKLRLLIFYLLEEVLKYKSAFEAKDLEVQELKEAFIKQTDVVKIVSLEVKSLKAELTASKEDAASLKKENAELSKKLQAQTSPNLEQLQKQILTETKEPQVAAKIGSVRKSIRKPVKSSGDCENDDDEPQELAQAQQQQSAMPPPSIRKRGPSKVPGDNTSKFEFDDDDDFQQLKAPLQQNRKNYYSADQEYEETADYDDYYNNLLVNKRRCRNNSEPMVARPSVVQQHHRQQHQQQHQQQQDTQMAFNDGRSKMLENYYPITIRPSAAQLSQRTKFQYPQPPAPHLLQEQRYRRQQQSSYVDNESDEYHPSELLMLGSRIVSKALPNNQLRSVNLQHQAQPQLLPRGWQPVQFLEEDDDQQCSSYNEYSEERPRKTFRANIAPIQQCSSRIQQHAFMPSRQQQFQRFEVPDEDGDDYAVPDYLTEKRQSSSNGRSVVKADMLPKRGWQSIGEPIQQNLYYG